MQPMDIHEASRAYEAWLGRQTPVVRADLRLKHARMCESPFVFLRATFYRWLQCWPDVCPRLLDAPRVLAVGDLHVENFGTWRDQEGRLIWGVNDVDEACRLPYTQDLVRLAASALLAIRTGAFALSASDACAAILAGYAACLARGGRPLVLEEQHPWLRDIALGALRDPAAFWMKLTGLKTATGPIPHDALRSILPGRGLSYRVVRRVAGAGSLGLAGGAPVRCPCRSGLRVAATLWGALARQRGAGDTGEGGRTDRFGGSAAGGGWLRRLRQRPRAVLSRRPIAKAAGRR